MQKIGLYIILILSFFALMIASSPVLMYMTREIIPNPYRYGGLYLFSDLKQFKQVKDYSPPVYTHSKIKDINLYILGDSYTEFMDSTYLNVNHNKFISWDFPPRNIQPLDTRKKNILIIECIDWRLRDRFKLPANDHMVIKTGNDPLKGRTLGSLIFNFKEENNLSYILTYSDLAFFLKEIKAWINLTIFNRVDEHVTLSPNRQYIFLKMITDTTLGYSPFNHLNDTEVDVIVQNINSTYRHFRSIGFSQVYFSIIPNELSLLYSNESNYNHLTERVEESSKLEIPTIDISRLFKRSPSDYYYKGDEHWNRNGYTAWLQKVDSILYSTSIK